MGIKSSQSVSLSVAVRHLLSNLPIILFCQLITKIILVILVILFKCVARLLLASIGRSAFTSGDLIYTLASWQGIVLILFCFLLLTLYLAFDISTMILLSYKLVRNEKVNFLVLFREALSSIKKFFCPHGVLIILYVAFIAPLMGGALEISLTSDLVLPDFIASVIESNPLLSVLYIIATLVLMMVGIVYIYTIHFILADQLSPKLAMRSAKSWMQKNWKIFLKKYGLFVISSVLAITLILIFGIALIFLLDKLILNVAIARFLTILVFTIVMLTVGLCALLFVPMQIIELTCILEDCYENKKIPQKNVSFLLVISSVAVVICAIFSLVATLNFDIVFPEKVSSEIIAHRGGGDLSSENTAESILVAHEHGAYASEIDVQRTKDGYYILNHDNNFLRLANDPRTPAEMTLAEIKDLRMKDGSQFSTLDEALRAAKNKIRLYIELKGSTADKQMVDDVYQKIIDANMINQVSVISLKYDLIDYAENTYPELQTSYLAFFGFGDISKLNADDFALESEYATVENIDLIHNANKRVDVWTCNTILSITKNIVNGANGIITDKVDTAQKINSLMQERSDLARITEILLFSWN